jgi:hypothetical protein
MTSPKVQTAFRAATIAVVAAWSLLSITGSFRRAAAYAWEGVSRRGQAPPGKVDARAQWQGYYYNTLDALAREPLTRATTVAAVLTQPDFTGRKGVASPRTGETSYRLYPTKVDFYLLTASGSCEPYWFAAPSPSHPFPRIPPLWQHDYVLWAGGYPLPTPAGYRLIYRSSEAALYRRVAPERH